MAIGFSTGSIAHGDFNAALQNLQDQDIQSGSRSSWLKKGVTNKKLAQALHVAQFTVSHWCTNDMQPSIETLFHIAGYLKVEARDLLVLMKE